MIRKLAYLLLISLTLYSCKKEQEEVRRTEDNKIAISLQNVFQAPPVYLDSLATEQDLIKHFRKRKEEIAVFLKDSTPRDADKLYVNLKKENDSALVLLQKKKETLLNKYMEYGTYDAETEVYSLNLPPEVEQLTQDYNKAGLEFWDIGEGITDLRMMPTYYSQLFTGKLSPDYQTYLDLRTAEDQVLFQADASISIPWRDVAKRVEDREKFLLDFPTSALTEEVTQELKEYQYAYLLGYDNTQTNEQGKLNKENVVEFRRFIKENPTSETTKIIKDLLRRSFTRDSLHQFVTEKIGYNLYQE